MATLLLMVDMTELSIFNPTNGRWPDRCGVDILTNRDASLPQRMAHTEMFSRGSAYIENPMCPYHTRTLRFDWSRNMRNERSCLKGGSTICVCIWGGYSNEPCSKNITKSKYGGTSRTDRYLISIFAASDSERRDWASRHDHGIFKYVLSLKHPHRISFIGI